MRTIARKARRAEARLLLWTDRLATCAAAMLLVFALAGCSLLKTGGGPGTEVETADETPATAG